MHANFFPPPNCPEHGAPLVPTRRRNQLVCVAVFPCPYFERIDPLQLYNVIVIWDVYAVAKTPEAAIECVQTWIKTGELPSSSANTIEARDSRNVRAEWIDQKPLVADDLNDEEFDSLKGRTTNEVFQRFYSKRG